MNLFYRFILARESNAERWHYANGIFVDAQGIIYSTDYNGGLSVIEYLG